MPILAQGNAAGCEVGSGIPEAMLSHPNYSLASSRICFAVIFGGYQARAGWAGILWPQTVLLLFPQLSSHCYPVRSHWQLDPRAEGFPRGSVVWGMR